MGLLVAGIICTTFLAATGAQSQQISGYVAMVGKAPVGRGLGGTEFNVVPQDCANACTAYQQCVGFLFQQSLNNPNIGSCNWFTTVTDYRMGFTYTIFYQKAKYAIPTVTQPPMLYRSAVTFVSKPNTACDQRSGAKIGEYYQMVQGDCQKRCARDPRCDGFVHWSGADICSLYSRPCTEIDVSYWDDDYYSHTYYRKQQY